MARVDNPPGRPVVVYTPRLPPPTTVIVRSLLSALLLAAVAGCAGSPPTADPGDRDARARRRRALLRTSRRSARDARRAEPLGRLRRRSTLSGTATLGIERAPGATEIVLDTRDLTIEAVTDPSGAPLSFRVGDADPFLGAPLTVQLPVSTNKIVVRYRTSPSAAALQWLTPAQTVRRQAVPVHAGPGHPDAHLDPDPGQPGHPPDLRGQHHGPGRR